MNPRRAWSVGGAALAALFLISWTLTPRSDVIPILTGADCEGSSSLSSYVGTDGCIRFPANYQTLWTHLGSWAIPGEDGGVHDVYTQGSSIEGFRANGVFPNGSVLVKSVRGVTHERLTTGDAHRATDQMVWFVMVKDSENRFAESNALWGDGWGWALFNAADSTTQTATNYVTDCKGCHVPRELTDWLYVEGYPVLQGP